ncbi:MAG: dTDP-4-dehydrorhamnose 3,5-epimerase [Lachnospiraceae bacterium]|nr:dTDP-4-dehydrorhamnose 3,5-epimerase [Lachnospiraceae bacterium]
MGKLTVTRCDIDGLFIIEPTVFRDERGYFVETYNEKDFKDAGIDCTFVQDNQSMSSKGILRGLHYQLAHPQAKLVRALSGEILDVVVDLRSASPTFGKSFSIRLSAENHKQLFVPAGFAHGYLVLSDTAIFSYKCADFYTPGDEYGILWNDSALDIVWPTLEGISFQPNARDQAWPTLAEAKEKGWIF